MALQKQAEPFTDTPNSALRKLLGLDHEQEKSSDDVQSVRLVGFSSKEGYDPEEGGEFVSFESPEEVRGFFKEMRDVLTRGEKYRYLAAGDRFWKNVQADSICLFHKNKHIVGEGKMNGKAKPYVVRDGVTEICPVTERPYAREVYFNPATIRQYKRTIPLAEAEKAHGRKK
ncbi:MAG: hypothetical protein AAB369_04850, partial [Chloroflexota bacterium]